MGLQYPLPAAAGQVRSGADALDVLVPDFDGASFSMGWEEALWDKFMVMQEIIVWHSAAWLQVCARCALRDVCDIDPWTCRRGSLHWPLAEIDLLSFPHPEFF